MKTKDIQHLYLRAGFGLEYKDLKKLEYKSKDEIVNSLFNHSYNFEPLHIDLSELENLKKSSNKENKRKIKKTSKRKIEEFNHAWISRMSNTDSVLREKMTLFWANVFVCRDNNAQLTQRYNNVLRKNSLGDFRDFVKEIAKEPSMLKYLNNKQNVKESPNENFARELMELFTLGMGNYTEQDIKESARAFTGWTFRKNGEFFVRKKHHDSGKKTFMGKTGNFDGDDIIDIITEQKQCARFICNKIYRYFVNPTVESYRLEEITNVFYRDYDIENLMKYIFSSEWFYNDINIGAKIKSPIELLVGIKKVVPFELNKPKQQIYLQKMMGQVLFYPPNVAGWKGDRYWIDSNTLMFRLKLASMILNNGTIDLDEKGNLEDDYEEYYNKRKKGKRFLKADVSWEDFNNKYTENFATELKKSLIISGIDIDTNDLLSNLKIESKKEYCIQLMSIPEYQLC